MTMKTNQKAFTLIELLVVIAIIASIVAMAIPNYLSARQRAQDAKKKMEMVQLKNALRLYYNDYNKYPVDNSPGPLYVQIKGCGATGTSNCDRTVCTTVDFAAGGSGCDTIYMKQFPTGFGPNASSKTIFYFNNAAKDDFCLTSAMSNQSDPDIAVSLARCTTACLIGSTQYCSSSKYCVCAD
jgi:prepilin-type N-terminal cleavage/methylation domain-containing protein